ncbi:MAG: hypothetical protein MJD61_04855, partial [Proteobacteria bacterium]|nr:hypothetical protein [Pseudomonadota bacterium]
MLPIDQKRVYSARSRLGVPSGPSTPFFGSALFGFLDSVAIGLDGDEFTSVDEAVDEGDDTG